VSCSKVIDSVRAAGTLLGRNLIQRSWIQYFQSSPERAKARIAQSWDTAQKGDQIHDYAVGTTRLYADEKHFLIDLVRKQCDYPTLSRLVLEQYGKHRPLAPGPVWTPLIPASFDEQHVAKHGGSVPLSRDAQPNDIAPSFVFLASRESSFISGQVLHPNGGTAVGS
jgi:enoyl-ACP reductase-like protein